MPLGLLAAASGSILGNLAGQAIMGSKPDDVIDAPVEGINVSATRSGLSREDLERLLADLTQAEGVARGDIEGSLEDVLQTLQATEAQMQGLQGPAQAANAAALQQLQALSGIGGFEQGDVLERLQATPGFQFREQQGRQAVERSGAARGLLESGAILKDLTKFGQGLASQEFGNEQQRLLALANATSNQALAGQGSLQALGMARGQAQQAGGSQLANIAQQAASQRASGLLAGGERFQDTVSAKIGGMQGLDVSDLVNEIPTLSGLFRPPTS